MDTKAKKENISPEGIKAIEAPRKVHLLEAKPVDFANLTVFLLGRNNDGHEEIKRVDFKGYEALEREIRREKGLPIDTGELEKDSPYVYDFLRAFEASVSVQNNQYSDSWGYKFKGLETFIGFGYERRLNRLSELDARPEIWGEYYEYCKTLLRDDGKEYGTGRGTRFLGFIKVLSDARHLKQHYVTWYADSPTSNLRRALAETISLTDRDKLYRQLKSNARHLVNKQLQIWRDIREVVSKEKSLPLDYELLHTNSKAEFKFKLKTLYRNNQSDFLDLIKTWNSNDGNVYFDSTTLLQSLNQGGEEHPFIRWLKVQYVEVTLSRTLGLGRATNTHSPTRKIEAGPIDILKNDFPTNRTTLSDAITTFANFIRKHGHKNYDVIKELTKPEQKIFGQMRALFYPTTLDVMPIYFYLNLSTGWNLDTIQQISFDIDTVISVVDSTELTTTYQIYSHKNRALGEAQTTYVQVSKAKEDETLNLPRLFREYREHLLFLNQLAPLDGFKDEDLRLLYFFPMQGERDRLGTFKGGDRIAKTVATKISSSLRGCSAALDIFKENNYTISEGRRLYAEHLYELHNRDFNVVKAGLNHNSYLIQYLQNVVYVRKGQLEVADFQAVILKFLKLKRDVDPTSLTIGYRVQNENEQVVFLDKLAKYRASNGLNCSSGYVSPRTEKETCRTGRCTLCDNARINQFSWRGLSTRIGELIWLQTASELGHECLQNYRVFEEQDAILATLCHPEFETNLAEMVEIWASTIENLQQQNEAGNLDIEGLLV